eukprot:702068-Pleurochrysis_carterae.AAC.1
MALGYTVCSSMLMVSNKLALSAFPFPSLLMALQFLASATVRGAVYTRFGARSCNGSARACVLRLWPAVWVSSSLSCLRTAL